MASYLEKLFSLEDHLAVVTGGTRGIGQAMALALARAGSDIILVQRNESNLETKSLIESLGRKAIIYTADLADQESVSALTKKILQDGHDVDIITNVHNAELVYARTCLYPQNSELRSSPLGLTAVALHPWRTCL